MMATVRVVLAIGLLVVAAWAVANRPSGENLVKNGSFEAPGAFGQIGAPAHWEGVGMGTFPALVQDCTVAQDGKCSLKIMSDKFVMASVLQEVTLKPDQYYRLTAWVKTEKFETQGEADMYGAMVVLPSNAEDEAKLTKSSNHGAMADWTQMTIEFKAEGKDPINIMCSYCGQGTGKGIMWFDNIRIVPIDKPTTTTSAPADKATMPERPATQSATTHPE